jgi:Tol biopolymer transport system component
VGNVSDPSVTETGVWLALVDKKIGGGYDNVWIMTADNSFSAQWTFNGPSKFSGNTPGPINFGDYDPKMNETANAVLCMRYHGTGGNANARWKIVSINTISQVETYLTPLANNLCEGLPDWSSDGQKIVFIRLDTTDFSQYGIYTMNANGTNKQMIPLPRGYLYGHPHFYPGETAANGNNMRIVFSATEVPGLP